jgi:hypothetical protein
MKGILSSFFSSSYIILHTYHHTRNKETHHVRHKNDLKGQLIYSLFLTNLEDFSFTVGKYIYIYIYIYTIYIFNLKGQLIYLLSF